MYQAVPNASGRANVSTPHVVSQTTGRDMLLWDVPWLQFSSITVCETWSWVSW